MQTAIAYIRVSDPRQVVEGNSLASQKRLAKQHCSNRQYVLDRVFEERGESAKTDHRTVLKEMLTYCRQRKGKIDVLIVPKIDRLARYSVDYGNIKIQLGRYGVRVESIGESFDDSPAGKFTENVLAAAAQLDNEVRAERCKGGMIDAVVEEGRWVWKAPIGYKNVRFSKRGTIEPDPQKAPYIVEAFERLSSGLFSQKTVWLWLNEQGVKVSRPHFHTMIRNKAYIGKIEAFGKIVNAKPPFIALISESTFYRAWTKTAKPEKSRGSYDRDNADFPLRGTVRCGCGRFFTACWSRGESRLYPYYRCRTCSRANRRRKQIHDAFVEVLNRFRPEDRLLEQLLPRIYMSLYRDHEASLQRKELAKVKIAECKSLQTALSLKNAKGVIPDRVAAEQIELLEQEISVFQADLDVDVTALSQEIVFSALGFLANVGFWWQSAPLKLQKKLQCMLFRTGLTYRADGGCRTDEYGLLGLIIGALHGDDLSLVGLREERAEFEGLLISLHKEFIVSGRVDVEDARQDKLACQTDSLAIKKSRRSGSSDAF